MPGVRNSQLISPNWQWWNRSEKRTGRHVRDEADHYDPPEEALLAVVGSAVLHRVDLVRVVVDAETRWMRLCSVSTDLTIGSVIEPVVLGQDLDNSGARVRPSSTRKGRGSGGSTVRSCASSKSPLLLTKSIVSRSAGGVL